MIEDENRELHVKLNGDNILATSEYIKISFSEKILEDIEFLSDLSGKEGFKVRHANAIIRNMLEQTIEFIYLLRNPQYQKEYFESNNKNKGTLGKKYKDIGDKSYKRGNDGIKNMAKQIDEHHSTNDKLSLYELYQILSHEYHNSYFFSDLDMVEEIECGEKIIPLTDDQIFYLQLIVERFITVYIEKEADWE